MQRRSQLILVIFTSVFILSSLCADKPVVVSVEQQESQKKPSLLRRLVTYGAIAWGIAGVLVGFIAWRNHKKCSPKSRALVAAVRQSDGFYQPDHLTMPEQKMAIESAILRNCKAESLVLCDVPIRNAQKKIYRAFCYYRLRKSAKLRPFVVAPAKENENVFARTAWVIAQIPELATPHYREQRFKKLAPLLETRMKSIKIDRGALAKTLTTDRPYEMLDAIEEAHDRLLTALSTYGKVVSFKKPSVFNRFFLEVDHTFIFRFQPYGMTKKVILKISGLPYYKLQEWYRDDGLEGENHGLWRNVDRALVADAIRATRGDSKVTAPAKYLARRSESDGKPLDDTTAVIMTECVEPGGTPWPWTLSRADKDRIRELAVTHQLPDLHPLNFLRGPDGVWYLIDAEKNHAKHKLTGDECRKNLWWLF
ncbi:MAG: hypothetical protein QG632_648 [Candidatus Dependentiae bacterium]|nr:hypothetical protein [Candidatus Dependentiae bacterium]